MWAEFVVDSRLFPWVFLWVLRFSSLHKNQHFQISTRVDWETMEVRATSWSLLKFLFIFIYLFIYLLFVHCFFLSIAMDQPILVLEL